ncbi:hypothetical protein NHJ13051_005723 [Beauveria bassiana]
MVGARVVGVPALDRPWLAPITGNRLTDRVAASQVALGDGTSARD